MASDRNLSPTFFKEERESWSTLTEKFQPAGIQRTKLNVLLLSGLCFCLGSAFSSMLSSLTTPSRRLSVS